MASREDQLRQSFQPRLDRVRSALAQSAEERRCFDDAEATRQRLRAEIDEARQEMQRLPGAAAKALLTSDADEGAQSVDGLKARYRELEKLISDREQRIADAEAVMNHEDHRTAESLSLQRAQSVARREIEAARAERGELVRALDEALEELQREASEAFALQEVRSTQEVS